MSEIDLILTRLHASRDYADDLGERIELGQLKHANAISKVRKSDGKNIIFEYTFNSGLTAADIMDFRITFSTAVHHLRSVCDNLAVAIGRKACIKGADHLAFPVRQVDLISAGIEPKQTFEYWASESKLGADVIDVIRKTQPYNSTVGKFGMLTGHEHPLSILNILSNHDKHRMLTVCATISKGLFFQGIASLKQRGFHAEAYFRADFTYENGDKMGRITIPIGSPENTFDLILPFQVVINKVEVPERMRIAYELLIYLHDFVRDEIVEPLRSFV